jgi:hypothetical protein
MDQTASPSQTSTLVVAIINLSAKRTTHLHNFSHVNNILPFSTRAGVLPTSASQAAGRCTEHKARCASEPWPMTFCGAKEGYCLALPCAMHRSLPKLAQHYTREQHVFCFASLVHKQYLSPVCVSARSCSRR